MSIEDEDWTSEELQLYHEFIDGLVEKSRMGLSNNAKSVKPNGYPDLAIVSGEEGVAERNQKYNKVLGELTSEQLEAVKGMVHESYEGGIHDVLVYLSENINLNGLRLSRNGIELPVKPYFNDLHYDWLNRIDGEEWWQEDEK